MITCIALRERERERVILSGELHPEANKTLKLWSRNLQHISFKVENGPPDDDDDIVTRKREY